MVATQLKPPKILKEPPRHTSKPRSSPGSEAPCPTLGCQCYLSAIDVRSISNAISITKGKKHNIPYMFFFIPPDGSFLFFYGVWSIHVFPQDVFPRPATRVAASSAHLPPLPVATGARRSSASWGYKEDVGPQPGSTYQALVALTPVK